ncbi:MAG: zinc ribbon domain-containing protein [Clostridia bacterium]|nr:zinc ribbon domain-containing protein [Clostridia bacterium]
MQDKQNPSAPQQPNTVICRSCGAPFSADIPNCPYCGTMYLPAAEAAYMNKLEGVRTDLTALGEKPKEELKKNLRRLSGRLLVFGAILLVIVAAGFMLHSAKTRREAARYKAELRWQIEYFPLLDKAYAAGDWEWLGQAYGQSLSDSHSIYNYQHHAFCEFSWRLLQVKDRLREYDEGRQSAPWTLYYGAYLFDLERLRPVLLDGEYERLDGLRGPLLEELTQRFRLTEGDLKALRTEVTENGFASYEFCEALLKEKGL